MFLDAEVPPPKKLEVRLYPREAIRFSYRSDKVEVRLLAETLAKQHFVRSSNPSLPPISSLVHTLCAPFCVQLSAPGPRHAPVGAATKSLFAALVCELWRISSSVSCCPYPCTQKPFEDFQILWSHSFSKGMNLTADIASWICHEVHARSPSRSVGVMVARRKGLLLSLFWHPLFLFCSSALP